MALSKINFDTFVTVLKYLAKISAFHFEVSSLKKMRGFFLMRFVALNCQQLLHVTYKNNFKTKKFKPFSTFPEMRKCSTKFQI